MRCLQTFINKIIFTSEFFKIVKYTYKQNYFKRAVNTNKYQ